MDLQEFNEDYFDPLIENLLSVDKKVFLMGDFNIDLLKVDIDTPTTNFFDTITLNLFVPLKILPTRITTTTKTLVDNIYSNCTNFNDGISGNLTLSISDHLAQFLIIQEVIDKTSTKTNIYKRDYRNFDRENFILDPLNIEWNQVITIEINNPNESFNLFFSKIDSLINHYIPLRKLTRNEIKNKLKPWITSGIRNSMYFLRSLYTDNALIMEAYNTSIAMISRLQEFQSPLTDKFVDSLTEDGNGNIHS